MTKQRCSSYQATMKMEEIFVFEENLEKLERFHETTTTAAASPKATFETICKICGKCIRFKQNRHMLTHSADRPFSCHLCDKSFRLPVVLAAHLKTHDSVKPFRCKLCGQVFSRKSTLRIHQRIHSGIRPYECHLCLDTFSQKAILVRHLDTHSDKKMFHCAQCNTSYRRKSSLETHLRSRKHLNTTKENES